MSNIEDLKKKKKELEHNKKQLEKRIDEITQKIDDLKSKRYYLNMFGEVDEVSRNIIDDKLFILLEKYGNTFEMFKEAEKESEKRHLMREIEEFRNERNGYWKPDFVEDSNPKHCIVLHNNKLTTLATFKISYFAQFGYFKRLSDCERAIEIFGARILELYAD